MIKTIKQMILLNETGKQIRDALSVYLQMNIMITCTKIHANDKYLEEEYIPPWPHRGIYHICVKLVLIILQKYEMLK